MSIDIANDAPVAVDNAPTVVAPSARRFSALGIWQTIGPVAVCLTLVAVVAASNPAFFTGGGPGILALQATFILLMALGQSTVLNIGSIDLSNAAMAVFSAMVLAMTLGSLGPAALVVSVLVATLIGAINGALIAYTQVPSFALTLGTLGILQSASLVISDASTIYVTGNSQVLNPLFGTMMGKLPLAFWFSLGLAVVLWAVLKFTRLGQAMKAVGLNETGAIFSGIGNRGVKIAAFTISGFFAGLTGVMIVAQGGAASSFGLGSDLLLPGIAAAIVGGTAITGGATNPLLVIFGSLTVALVPIAAAVFNVPSTAQSMVYGLVIIIAVALTVGRKSGGVVK
ncbi:MAG: ABC transporter permease [Candidatus Nanopelagicales bacterium]